MQGASTPTLNSRLAAVLALLAFTALILQMRGWTESIPAHENLEKFPLSVGDWRGTAKTISPEAVAVLGPGEFLLRDFQRSATDAPVNLFIAYFPSQRSGDTIHSPQNCLPGSGWTPIEKTHIPLHYDVNHVVWINRYVVAKGLDRDLVLYWYQSHGRVTASDYWAKFYLFADSVRLHRTDGALIRIVTPLNKDENADQTEMRALAFARSIGPLLDQYIPN
jgi:EpsI family protein